MSIVNHHYLDPSHHIPQSFLRLLLDHKNGNVRRQVESMPEPLWANNKKRAKRRGTKSGKKENIRPTKWKPAGK